MNCITATGPSNIALVKYWGKKNLQQPVNASISFTLKNCITKTQIQFERLKNTSTLSQDIPDFHFLFEGKPQPSFLEKLNLFFKRITPDYLPCLSQYKLHINSENTFPHSSGIASSASAYAALAMGLVKLETVHNQEPLTDKHLQKASHIARLGSGSACRSLQGPLMLWGIHPICKNSSDLFAITLNEKIHPIFKDYQDTILLIEQGQKTVSSTIGHELMRGHPYEKGRIKQAQSNIENLYTALQTGNLDEFIRITEQEALSLHGLMMSSNPYFILMKPQTLTVIQKVWEFRKKTNSKLCFTLDAGANVHLLYPKTEKELILSFIEEELVDFCQEKRYLCDEVGWGAECIIS